MSDKLLEMRIAKGKNIRNYHSCLDNSKIKTGKINMDKKMNLYTKIEKVASQIYFRLYLCNDSLNICNSNAPDNASATAIINATDNY